MFVFAGLLVQVALRVWVFGGPSYFPGGYPLVVRPIYQVTTDPETVHRLTVLVSAVVAAMLFPVLVAILRRFGLRPPIALVIAFALALLPATL